MKLVIAEKPSAAQSYAKALNITAKKSGYFEGNGYIITWCIGHLAGLADARRMMKNTRYGNMRIYLSYLKNGSLP